MLGGTRAERVSVTPVIMGRPFTSLSKRGISPQTSSRGWTNSFLAIQLKMEVTRVIR